MPTILDGKLFAKAFLEEIKQDVKIIKDNKGKVPNLTIILIGKNSASHIYVKNKLDACKKVGFKSMLIEYDNIGENALLQKIDEINENPKIDGLLVQLPLPEHINTQKVINRIQPEKDVDGLHAFNYGRMACNLPTHIPATPLGILKLLKRHEIETAGKNCVVIGKTHIVGAPLSILMGREGKDYYPGNATVTLCDKITSDLNFFTQQADILITAAGKPGLITAPMVKKGATVIDVGITRVPNTNQQNGFVFQGDVDFKQVAPKCSYITPVPGGIGPMTVAALLQNTLRAAQKRVYIEANVPLYVS